MKITKISSLGLIVGFALAMMLPSCQNNPDVAPKDDLLPKSFRVAIPAAISNQAVANGGRISGRAKGDSLRGNDIYMNLNTFIAVGEMASKTVEMFIEGIRKYHIDRVLSLTYVAEDDNRTKNLVVVSQASFEGKTWDYQLTITDVESLGQADGGKALQIFWNNTSLVKGIAIIKPYNCDRVKNVDAGDAIFRVDYIEGGELGYDAHMEVRIAGLPLQSPLSDPFSISSLHMFAGKKGDVVDVYGNSNHPNAVFFSGDTGFNWAFVAAGSDPKDIGVAEVGLPPSNLDNSDRTVLLKDYSIKNVFTTKIFATWPGIDPALVAAYLSETSAPGYFSSKKGFLSGGVSPGPEWDALAARMDALSPYNPLQTSNLAVSFK